MKTIMIISADAAQRHYLAVQAAKQIDGVRACTRIMTDDDRSSVLVVDRLAANNVNLSVISEHEWSTRWPDADVIHVDDAVLDAIRQKVETP